MVVGSDVSPFLFFDFNASKRQSEKVRKPKFQNAEVFDGLLLGKQDDRVEVSYD